MCFHGFGQIAEDFRQLGKQHPNYKVIAINLFFHGNSFLNPIIKLQPCDWKLYMDKLIKEEAINRFSIMGYSMGGRFALITLSLYGSQTDKLYLIAPDGLVEGNWYRFATRSRSQRKLFRLVLNSYPTFLAISKFLSKIGLINKGLLKFAQVHLQNKDERTRVYNTWTCFRLLNLSPNKLHTILKTYKIPTEIILGNYDRIIPLKRIESKVNDNSCFTIKKVPITHHKLFYYNFLDTP
jgi:pimeloyl-ACP methyl ester carboxylesterase